MDHSESPDLAQGGETSLEALQRLMAEFPEMNPGPVLRLKTDGTIEMINRAARAVLGDTAQAGLCWVDVCPGMDAQTWSVIQESREPTQFEAGTLEQCFLYTHVCRPDTGHIFVFGADVTAHRLAEHALQQQRAELAEMARFPDMNPGPVVRFGADGAIVLANPAARKLFGMGSLVGRNWFEICPGMSPDLQESILTAQRATHHEAALGERFIIFTHTPPTDAGNYFVYGADVTDRKAAEEELAARNAQIAEMAKFPDMNPGPVIRFIEDGTIRLANRAAQALFERESLVGLRWQDVCPGMTGALWKRIRDTDRNVTHETRVGERTLLFTHTPRTEAGNSFVYGSDITEQKAAERLLAQSEKMATLGTLSAGVAHELNNPAAAALRGAQHLKAAFTDFQRTMVQVGRLEMQESEYQRLLELDALARQRAADVSTLSAVQRMDLEEELQAWLDDHGITSGYEWIDEYVDASLSVDELDALAADIPGHHLDVVLCALARSLAVYRLLQEINHGTDRITSIVGALKEYSYLDQAPIQDVDVNQGVRNTLIILNAKLKEGVEVNQALAGDLPHIHAFGSELNQVWTNLIDNAIAAMEGQGHLNIRSREEEGGVCVEIEDSGPGVPDAIQHRIFDAFFTTKPPGSGTGLGLHTCYSIVVNKHGGKLTFTSSPGKTCFRVWLPLTVREDR